MDYTRFPGAVGISPNLRLTLDSDATKAQLVSELNNKTVSASSHFGISGTVVGDSRSSISGSISYQTGLASRDQVSGSTDHIDPDGGNSANRKNAADTSTMSFDFDFGKNANTQPTSPSTFDVTAKYSGSVYTSSGERSAQTEGVWWYYYRGQKYSRNEYFNNGDLATAINEALNGTKSNNSLIDTSTVGGQLHINFTLTTGDSVKYTSDGTELTGTIGNYTLHMNVNEGETAGNIINRIANIRGVDITNSSPSTMTMYNGSANYFKANIYAGTMQLNIQAGSESSDDNIIPLIYDVLNNHSLGINAIGTQTRETSLEALDKVKSASKVVDEQRAVFGAYQNRMEHAYKNLTNTVENTQQAESLIRDTDMAAEMVKYSNENILAQAGQSMLAQANQTNQGVLSLLQ
ncbi:flagellin [Butyrivibrio sp. FCS006]|uniref:flagellin n=1 Tax=unclassified Butyrivibrio TaxID=2639466 RepID=UPI003FA48FE8